MSGSGGRGIDKLEALRADLRTHGLHVLGRVAAEAGDALPPLEDGRPVAVIVLVGNIGSSLWEAFHASPEHADGAPDPLDRWSMRVASSIASTHSATPYYPFGGPPFRPFQRWARRAGTLFPSPLGLLISPATGLWQAYRFALGFAADTIEIEAAQVDACSPCASCSDQPCLTRCPAQAFDAAGHHLQRCITHLHRDPHASCHSSGCLARLACPVAAGLRYLPAHQAFHMRAFVAAHPPEPGQQATRA